MTTRRSALKSIGMAALTAPLLATHRNDFVDTLPDKNDPAYWKKIRKQFMLPANEVFFNPGTVGVMPTVVVEKTTQHLRYLAAHVSDWAYKDDNKEEFISGYNNLQSLRTKVGQLINASANEIAMTDNVTHGMSYIANGLSLQPGDEVLTSNQEHVGGQSGFQLKEKRYGVIFKTVTLGKPIIDAEEVYDAVLKAVTPKTKVLMLSHIISGSGAILPIKELCTEMRKRNIFTIIDGAQTIGQIHVDVKDLGCDAYAGCFHKWMGAPAGTGFLYIHPDRAKEIWTTVASGRWDYHDDEGFRFTQRGTGSFSILKGLEAALDFHVQIGPNMVYDRIKFLGKRLRDALRATDGVIIYSPKDEAMCAGISVYNIKGMTGPVLQDLFWQKERMRPRSMGNTYGVRHCTHIFNNEDEIDRAIDFVKGLALEKR
jgi:isopenicillin-N epimerase